MKSKIQIDFEKILPLAALALAAVIVLGTAAAFLAGKRPGTAYRKSDPQSVAEIKGFSSEQKEFKEFGTFRCRLLPEKGSKSGGEEGAILVVTPWLSYESKDSAFYEELVSKKKIFSSCVTQFFSSRTKNELLSIGEKEIKRRLLEQFNERLSLGKASAIYFDDYIFLD